MVPCSLACSDLISLGKMLTREVSVVDLPRIHRQPHGLNERAD